MQKKYTQSIIQYSLDGTLIKEFENAQQTKSIIHYDALINCCSLISMVETSSP